MCFSHTTSTSEAPSLDPRCDLSLEQGTCRNYSIYWYYDKQANSCAQFWYGGCGGNDNRYETEDECKRACVLNRKGNIGKLLTANICSFFLFHYWILYYFPQQDKGEENIRKWTFQFFNLLISYSILMHSVSCVQKILCTFLTLLSTHRCIFYHIAKQF